MGEEAKCKYCKGSCGCGGPVNAVLEFCCESCQRDYEGCRTMYPDAEDPVAAYWADSREADRG